MLVLGLYIWIFIMDVVHKALDRLFASFFGVRVKVQLEWSMVNEYEDR